MGRSIWLSSALILGVLVVACQTSTGATNGKEDADLCEPGAFVFCYCKNEERGTKLCQSDGNTFTQCKAKGETPCDEIEGEDSNKKVDSNGAVIPEGDDDDDVPVVVGSSDLDKCPGKSISLRANSSVKLEGDTSRATEDRRGKPGGACAAANGSKDFVYALTAAAGGKLVVQVTGKGALDPITYLRTDCADETTQTACGEQSGNKVATLTKNVKKGVTYFLFIDGASGGSGEYSATLSHTAGPFCGDGELADGEACDDGNNADGDGCSASCQRVDGNPTSGGSCTSGHPVDVWPGKTVVGSGSTATYPNSLGTPARTCSASDLGGTNTHNDHVYKVTPHASGNMTVTLQPKLQGVNGGPNLMLTAHAQCAAAAPTTGCANQETAGVAETMTVAVTSGTPVFIAVDGGGITNNSGDYEITFKIQ